MLKLNIAAAVALFALVGCGDDGTDPAPAGGAGGGGAPAVGGMAGGGTPVGGMGGTPTPTGGAPAGGAGGGAPALSYAADIEPLFTAAPGLCFACHAVASATNTLILAKGMGFESLKQPSTQVMMKLIGPTSAESYLYHKVANTHTGIPTLPTFMPPAGAGPNGARMPAAGLPQESIDKVKAWIDSGANP